MRRYSPLYFLSQSFKGLWRNGLMSLASVTVLLSCLVLMGSFATLVYNININLESITLLNQIVVIVDYDATDEQVDKIGEEIRKLDNVAKVDFVSKEEGLETEKKRYEEYSYIFEEIGDENPLPDVFKVTYADNSRVSNLVYELKQIENVNKVNNRMDIANDIENLKSGISFVFLWFLVILFVVSIFIIINTIKIGVETRSREISAMRYIGATNFFMMTPFMIEGIIIGLLSAGIGYFVQMALYDYVYERIGTNYSMITIIPFASISQYVLIGFFIIGVIAGVIGSGISLRRYMKV